MKQSYAREYPFVCSIAWIALAVLAIAGTPIPADKIAELEKDVVEAAREKPRSSSQRRAYKRIARTGNDLLEKYPEAPNRFKLLSIMLSSQTTVLKLEDNDRNRKVLFEICEQLIKAPDECAEERLDADVLVMDRELAERNASAGDREEALLNLIQRYRGTPGEPKSLMMSAVIAKDMGASSLLKSIEKIMDERCADRPEVIAFRRTTLSLKSLAVKCKGYYRRADGTYLHIPGDRIGHQCLLVFWSKENTRIDKLMEEIKAQQERFPGLIEVYSLNLDQLPDAGQTFLREKGLDWQAMHVPDGKRNIYFRAYGASSPIALFVNAFGYTVLNPFGVNPDTQGWRHVDSGVFQISPSRVSHPRYLTQLQSIVIGDFLVNDTEGAFDPSLPPELKMAIRKGDGTTDKLARTDASIPEATLLAIQECFTVPPFRYRLKKDAATKTYTKAEELCASAIKNHPSAPDLWIVRNRRIIALLGLWNLVCEPKYLEQATAEAKLVLNGNLPKEAQVVARFCLARSALREDKVDPIEVIRAMVAETGGDDAPVSAFGAASVLALEGDRRQLHEDYRLKVLKMEAVYPMHFLRTFLQNRYQRFYLLRPNTTRGDRMGWSRGYIVNHQWDQDAPEFPDIKLENLDGSEFSLPNNSSSKQTLLLFVEPPPDEKEDFPFALDRNGKPTKDDPIRKVISDAYGLADAHLTKEVDVVLAFISDDADRVKSLMKANDWTGRAVLVPGGLGSPVIRELGIVSADKLPNVFLLRRNGRIGWRNSGYIYQSEFGFPFAVLLAMKVHIEIGDLMVGFNALKKNDFATASKYFSNSFKLARPDRFAWHSPRYHAHAIARMGVNDWKGALDSIEKAIDAHKLLHGRGYKRSKNINDWRKDAAIIPIKEPCDILKELWTTKAVILEKLEQKNEASALRARAETATREDSESLYSLFHHHMRVFRTDVLKEN